MESSKYSEIKKRIKLVNNIGGRFPILTNMLPNTSDIDYYTALSHMMMELLDQNTRKFENGNQTLEEYEEEKHYIKLQYGIYRYKSFICEYNEQIDEIMEKERRLNPGCSPLNNEKLRELFSKKSSDQKKLDELLKAYSEPYDKNQSKLGFNKND